MTDPERLHLDPESPLERSLLTAGRNYRASPQTRARLLGALGISGASAASAATSSAAALAKAALGKVALGVLLIGGLAIPAAWYVRGHEGRLEAPAPLATRAPAVPPLLRVEVATPPEVPAPPASVSAARMEPRSIEPSAPLSAELAALDGVRAALSRGEATTALSGLDAYARDYPRGKLRLEAEVLRIASLAKSGQSATARRRAQAFLQRHPNSLLAACVRGYAAP